MKKPAEYEIVKAAVFDSKWWSITVEEVECMTQLKHDDHSPQDLGHTMIGVQIIMSKQKSASECQEGNGTG